MVFFIGLVAGTIIGGTLMILIIILTKSSCYSHMWEKKETIGDSVDDEGRKFEISIYECIDCHETEEIAIINEIN